MGIEIRTATLDGRSITYTDETEFLVQVGKGPRGAYRTKYSFKGNLAQAVLWYKGINIGYGYKKRLLMPSADKPVLARHAS